jgi:hypothetical protein
MAALMDAWFDLLDGVITYSGKSVKVYKEDTPEDLDETPTVSPHYILLRAEGETDDSTKQYFINESIVIVDIVTKFHNNVNRSVADNIDGQISALVLPTRANGLPTQSGMIIANVSKQTTNYLYETSEQGKYYRKICRYKQDIFQTS